VAHLERSAKTMKLVLLIFVALLSSCSNPHGQSVAAPPFSPHGDFSQADGIQYKILRKGSGRSAVTAKHATVWYEARLGSNYKVFDSAYKRNEPAKFPLNQMIPGFEIGLRMMQEGDVFLFKIPSELAYGRKGSPPVIAPDETLFFTVELLQISN
jgi:FKBP-type peptidyl-prolyl cis-trans isomerase FkpA